MCQYENGDPSDWIKRTENEKGARRTESKYCSIFADHHKRLQTETNADENIA